MDTHKESLEKARQLLNIALNEEGILKKQIVELTNLPERIIEKIIKEEFNESDKDYFKNIDYIDSSFTYLAEILGFDSFDYFEKKNIEQIINFTKPSLNYKKIKDIKDIYRFNEIAFNQINMDKLYKKDDSDNFIRETIDREFSNEEIINYLMINEHNTIVFDEHINDIGIVYQSKNSTIIVINGNKHKALIDYLKENNIDIGFNDELYSASDYNLKQGTYGHYIDLIKKCYKDGKFSNGKYESYMIAGIRLDILYGVKSENDISSENVSYEDNKNE